MTSLAASAAGTPAVDGRGLGPPEGWTSILLLGVMLATLSLAVDGAGWAGRTAWGASETAFLVPAILLGGLVGLVLARTGLSWLAADAIGAAIGALFLVQAVAGVVSNAPDVGTRLAALVTSVALFYRDLVIEGSRSSQTSVFLLVIGALTWATGQYASILVFRRRRAVSAVVLTGLFLFIELSVTIRDQYLYLVIFTAAALLFLVRLNLVEQRAGWIRRRIGDTGHVSNLYVRSGLVFVAFALAGALALTATATSAPLFGWWRGLDGSLLAWGQRLNLVVGGVSGEVRGPSDLFASTATITGVWQASDEAVFDYSTVTPGGLYWLGATYDSFDGTTWHQTDRSAGVQVNADGQLLAPTTDGLEPREELDKVKATVTDEDFDAPTVLSPELPTSVDRLATVYTSGRQGPFVSAEFVDSLRAGESYTVDALAWSFDPDTGLTGAKLASAPAVYPSWLRRYVAWENSAGPLARETADRIVAGLAPGQRDPYHIAAAIQQYLYADGGFTYNTDVRALCSGRDLVDCFLRAKQGYCEYFATAMTIMLRTQGIPARYVRGYLPGTLVAPGTDTYVVARGAAHAWVEVYFPGYGWVRFDPTPGNLGNGQRPTTLAAGATGQASGPAGTPARPTFVDPGATDRPLASEAPGAAAASSSGPGPGGLFAVVGLLAAGLLVAVLLAAARWRRAPDLPEPDAIYRGVAGLAGRFGYGPRPTQTAYEYARSLGEILPMARPELEVVAHAKVLAAYAGRPPRGATLVALRQAYRHLRIRLLRLAFRRRWPGGPGAAGSVGAPEVRVVRDREDRS